VFRFASCFVNRGCYNTTYLTIHKCPKCLSNVSSLRASLSTEIVGGRSSSSCELPCFNGALGWGLRGASGGFDIDSAPPTLPSISSFRSTRPVSGSRVPVLYRSLLDARNCCNAVALGRSIPFGDCKKCSSATAGVS
jgi:hypothetical protein